LNLLNVNYLFDFMENQTYLSTLKYRNNTSFLKDVSVTGIQCSSDALHLVVGLVGLLTRERLCTSQPVPSVIDEHLNAWVRAVIGIHDEPGDMS